MSFCDWKLTQIFIVYIVSLNQRWPHPDIVSCNSINWFIVVVCVYDYRVARNELKWTILERWYNLNHWTDLRKYCVIRNQKSEASVPDFILHPFNESVFSKINRRYWRFEIVHLFFGWPCIADFRIMYFKKVVALSTMPE